MPGMPLAAAPDPGRNPSDLASRRRVLYVDSPMHSLDLPLLGNLVLCAILVSAGYAFAVSLAAGRGRPELLPSARAGVYATCALVAVAVLVLAYAFQSHDFR